MSESIKIPSAVMTAITASKRHPEWFFFPLPRGRKFPPPSNMLNDGARPPGATNDPAIIAKWKTANVGIAPHASRLTFMDVDTKPGKVGEQTLAALVAKHGALPRTLTVRTPSGGRHYWFYETPEVQHRFGVGAFGRDVDCPQYVLLPNSVIVEGGKSVGRYTVIDQSPIAAAPLWFAEYLKAGEAAPTVGDNDAPAVELDMPENIERGIYFLKNDAKRSIQFNGGEKALFDTAAVLKDLGISYDTAVELINEHYNVEGKCEPLWNLREGPEEDRLEKKIKNAYDYAKQTQPGALGIGAEADFKCDDPTEDQPQDDGSKSARLEIIRADTIKMQIIDWLWGGHLALGQHTCIAGVQGDGKSQLVYAIIAAITTGGKWPGSDEVAPIGDCIVLSAEDTDKDVLAPRLKAAGADLSRVHIIKASVDAHGRHTKVLLQRDLKLIAALVKRIGNVKLISIDPISSYLGGDIDSHNNTELRAALDPITQMAEATGCAVVSITHFNKASKGVTAMNRIMGSVAFVAAPRAAFVVLHDDEDDTLRLFLPVKLNLASVEEAYGMSFTVEEADTGVKDERNGKSIRAPRVKWLERVGKTADAVLAASDKTASGKSALDEATNYFLERLAFAPELKTVLEKEIEDMGTFSWATARNAQRKLGIISRKRPLADGHGPYEWMLPEVAADTAEPDMSATAPPGYQGPKGDAREELL